MPDHLTRDSIEGVRRACVYDGVTDEDLERMADEDEERANTVALTAQRRAHLLRNVCDYRAELALRDGAR